MKTLCFVLWMMLYLPVNFLGDYLFQLTHAPIPSSSTYGFAEFAADSTVLFVYIYVAVLLWRNQKTQ